jgi:hypothetical protein
MQFENGNGYGNDVGNPLGGSAAYLNLAYVTWAGITAGKAPSFYSFTCGGAAWYNFFSPDQQGFNQPDVLAYTASFGGGFSATIARAIAATAPAAAARIRATSAPTTSTTSRSAGTLPATVRASRISSAI